MLPSTLLSLVESRIVLILFFGGSVATSTVLKLARVSGSRWNREKEFLMRTGLISSAERRIFSESGIKRVVCYTLTQKGIEIARQIQIISGIIGNGNAMENEDSASSKTLKGIPGPIAP